MKLAMRFLLPLALVLGGLAWAVTPLLGELLERWLRTDVEMRSSLVFDSIGESLPRLIKDPVGLRIDALFTRLARDERLLAIGLCNPEGRLLNHSPTWPLGLACPPPPPPPVSPATAPAARYQTESWGGGSLLIAAFPLREEGLDLGQLVILHDLSFIERRNANLERYLMVFLGGPGAPGGGPDGDRRPADPEGLVAGGAPGPDLRLDGGGARPQPGPRDRRPGAGRTRGLARSGTATGPRRRHPGRLDPREPAPAAQIRTTRCPGDRRLQPRTLYPCPRRG